MLKRGLQHAYFIMAGKANTKAVEITPAIQTISAKVKSVKVNSDADNIRYVVQFDTMFDAIIRNRETDEYEESQVDYISFVPSVLIAQSLELVEGLDLMYTKKKETALRADQANGFGATELHVVLRNSKIELARTKFEVGDEYTDRNGEVHTHEYAGYNTDITKIVVTEKIQSKLDDLLDSIFEL